MEQESPPKCETLSSDRIRAVVERQRKPPQAFIDPPNTLRVADRMPEKYKDAISTCLHGEKPWPLTLQGIPGSGKTCASLVLHDYYGGWWTTERNLHRIVADIRRDLFRLDGYKYAEQRFWEDWRRCGLCIVDEFGVRVPTDPAADVSYEAINMREGLPLVICTNLTSKEIDAYYDHGIGRITSRMRGGTIVTFNEDLRDGRRAGKGKSDVAANRD